MSSIDLYRCRPQRYSSSILRASIPSLQWSFYWLMCRPTAAVRLIRTQYSVNHNAVSKMLSSLFKLYCVCLNALITHRLWCCDSQTHDDHDLNAATETEWRRGTHAETLSMTGHGRARYLWQRSKMGAEAHHNPILCFVMANHPFSYPLFHTRGATFTGDGGLGGHPPPLYTHTILKLHPPPVL
jgi:hypothetical protein